MRGAAHILPLFMLACGGSPTAFVEVSSSAATGAGGGPTTSAVGAGGGGASSTSGTTTTGTTGSGGAGGAGASTSVTTGQGGSGVGTGGSGGDGTGGGPCEPIPDPCGSLPPGVCGSTTNGCGVPLVCGSLSGACDDENLWCDQVGQFGDPNRCACQLVPPMDDKCAPFGPNKFAAHCGDSGPTEDTPPTCTDTGIVDPADSHIIWCCD